MHAVSPFRFDRSKFLKLAVLFNAVIIVFVVIAEWNVQGKSGGFSLVLIPLFLVLFVLSYSVNIVQKLAYPEIPYSFLITPLIVVVLFAGLLRFPSLTLLLMVVYVVIMLGKKPNLKEALPHIGFIIAISAIAVVADIVLSVGMMNLLLG